MLKMRFPIVTVKRHVVTKSHKLISPIDIYFFLSRICIKSIKCNMLKTVYN